MRLHIHQYERRLERAKELLEEVRISKKNRLIIKRFIDDCELQGLSKPRVIKLIECSKFFAKHIKADFDKADKEVIKDLVKTIECQEWKVWSKCTYKLFLRSFTNGSRATMSLILMRFVGFGVVLVFKI